MLGKGLGTRLGRGWVGGLGTRLGRGAGNEAR